MKEKENDSLVSDLGNRVNSSATFYWKNREKTSREKNTVNSSVLDIYNLEMAVEISRQKCQGG